MKRTSRLLSAALLLAALVHIVPVALASQPETVQLSLAASQDGVNHGEELSIALSADAAFTARGMGITLIYDDQVLEPVKNAKQEPFQVSSPIKVQDGTALRISFAPRDASCEVSHEAPIATLNFRTIAPTQSSAVVLSRVYGYDGELNPIVFDAQERVEFSVAAVDTKEIRLNYQFMNVETGQKRTLTAQVLPEKASDKTVEWSSSAETVASVDQKGVITGLTPGTAVITARNGDVTAQCTVTVKDPPNAGYVVSMSQQQSVYMGETIRFAPEIRNDSETEFHAFHIVLTYDPDALILVTNQIENMTMTDQSGTVEILCYGTARTMENTPFSLEFQPQKTGDTSIQLLSARVDKSENAMVENTAKAYIPEQTIPVSVLGYRVTLPSQEFTGPTTVQPGGSYTFEAIDKNFVYTFSGSTMGGGSVMVRDNADGTFTVENVTGTLVIETQKTGKEFDLAVGGNAANDLRYTGSKVRYNEDFAVSIMEDPDFNYSITVTIAEQSFAPTVADDGSFTIPGDKITGDVIIVAAKSPKPGSTPSVNYYTVRFTGSGAAAAGNGTSVESGSNYQFVLNRDQNYRYSVSYVMGSGQSTVLIPNDQGQYTIANITADVTVTITKEPVESAFTVTVHEYITLNNQKTIYLVLAKGNLDDIQTFVYDGNPMFYREAYDGWCILTVEDQTLGQSSAKAKVTRSGAVRLSLGNENNDVNQTGFVDINDAQLTYDLLNSKYLDFTTINMVQFLKADVNADKRVNVADAAKIAHEIQ